MRVSPPSLLVPLLLAAVAATDASAQCCAKHCVPPNRPSSCYGSDVYGTSVRCPDFLTVTGQGLGASPPDGAGCIRVSRTPRNSNDELACFGGAHDRLETFVGESCVCIDGICLIPSGLGVVTVATPDQCASAAAIGCEHDGVAIVQQNDPECPSYCWPIGGL